MKVSSLINCKLIFRELRQKSAWNYYITLMMPSKIKLNSEIGELEWWRWYYGGSDPFVIMSFEGGFRGFEIWAHHRKFNIEGERTGLDSPRSRIIYLSLCELHSSASLVWKLSGDFLKEKIPRIFYSTQRLLN